jgi:hypothetical protein
MSDPQPPPVEPSSPRKLLRSTLIALAVAVLLLVTVVLPAEYGIDPTGAGRVLGLTRMGEIKTRLAKEAAADAAADRAAAAAEDSAAARTRDSTTTPPPQ